MTVQPTTPTITTDGITITGTGDSPSGATYAVQGRRVNGNVTAVLSLDTDDEYQGGRRVRVQVPVTTTWFGSRTDPANPPMVVNGTEYVGHYAMTARGRYVGSVVNRLDNGKVTDNARAILHAIGSAVATLHASPARIDAARLRQADSAVESAQRAVTDAQAALDAARKARETVRLSVIASATELPA